MILHLGNHIDVYPSTNKLIEKLKYLTNLKYYNNLNLFQYLMDDKESYSKKIRILIKSIYDKLIVFILGIINS